MTEATHPASDCTHRDQRILVLVNKEDTGKKMFWCMRCESYIISYLAYDGRRIYLSSNTFGGTIDKGRRQFYSYMTGLPKGAMDGLLEQQQRGRFLYR